MMEKLITVVVPVYKVEPYIDKCLSSLIVPEEQLPLLEVIVVNDGTPDRSADMAREFERRYPDVFRVIDKENGGHGSAWNRGVKEATGKYLRFLDSDDWFTTSEFSRLIERLKTLDVDVVISNYNRYYVEADKTVKMPMYLEEGLNKTFPLDTFDWEKLSWERLNFWGCTYRTDMLKSVSPLFLEGVFYDDAVLFIAPAFLGKSFHVFDSTIYNYLIGRPGQTASPEIRKKRLADYKKTYFQIFDFADKHWDMIHSPGQKLFIARFLKDRFHDTLVRFSDESYKECRQCMKEWERYYHAIHRRIPDYDLSTQSIKQYQRLPFLLYYASRRVLSRLMPTNTQKNIS